jgi:hypothetical protein
MSFPVSSGGSSCMTQKGGFALTPATVGEQGALTGGARRRLRKTKGRARRAHVRSSTAGGSRKRKGSRKSKRSRKSKKSKRSRKH